MEKLDRRYILACSSAYDYGRFWTIRFDEAGNPTFVDVGAKDNLKDKKVFKNTLAEIDARTCGYSEKNFATQEISKGPIYVSKLGHLTIFYKDGNTIREIRPVFDNPLLAEKIPLVIGNIIHDKKEVDSFIRIIKSPDLKFVKYITHEKEMHNTALSSSTIKLIQDLRYYSNMPGGYTSNEVSAEMRYLEESLRERLTSYKEYRELFIAKYKFLGADSKEEAVEIKRPSPECEQMSFFPLTEEERGYSKRKRR